MKSKILFCAGLAVMATVFSGCNDDDPKVIMPGGEKIENTGNGGSVLGFYVLNEGNMGANKCTLDYFDYSTGMYHRNIYAACNPEVPLELGDTGNDIAVNNGRLYIVVNGSNKVEVLDAFTAKRIGQVDINSPRCVAFDGNYVYVSSYVGGANGNGSVVKFDANSLAVTGTCSVGLQPEEMVITDGSLFVVNSTDNNGTYDDKISQIDLATFTVTRNITAAINMHHLRLDKYGNMWATSRGNYWDIASSLVLLQKGTDGQYAKVREYPTECTNLSIGDAGLYYYSVTYDANWNATNAFYHNDINSAGIVGNADTFISGNAASILQSPYCIAVQPSNGTILVTDAKNYVSSGALYCFSAQGVLQWSATTGDIPGHIAFVNR